MLQYFRNIHLLLLAQEFSTYFVKKKIGSISYLRKMVCFYISELSTHLPHEEEGGTEAAGHDEADYVTRVFFFVPGICAPHASTGHAPSAAARSSSPLPSPPTPGSKV